MRTSDLKRTLRRLSVALSITAMFIAASNGLSERVADALEDFVPVHGNLLSVLVD